MTVKGEKVITQKKEIPSYLKVVMVIPDRPMSTNQSRAKLPKNYSMQKTVFNVSHAAVLTAAFFNEDWKTLKLASEDMMHQNIRMKMLKELYEVQKIALMNGALMSTLSGSGSSFFSMVHEDDALYLHQKLKKQFPKFRVETYNFNNIGYKFSE